MSGLGIVTALAAESRPLGPVIPHGGSLARLADGTVVAVSGMGQMAAARGAARLIAAGVRALVSFGMAGGLDPALTAGTLVLPREVISAEGARLGSDPAWRERLLGTLAAEQLLSEGNLLSDVQPLASIAAKARAFRTTGAVAVDMESLAVARAASSHGLPFIALRAIVDTAGDRLPPGLTAAAAAGTVCARVVLRSLVHAPADLVAFFRLALRYRAARRSLAGAARSGALAPPAETAHASRR